MNYKFQIGDKFTTPNSITGKIVGTQRKYGYDANYNRTLIHEYVVFWDHMSVPKQPFVYEAVEAERIWSPVLAPGQTYQGQWQNLSMSQDINPTDFLGVPKLNSENSTQECNHEFVDVGFHWSKIVCKHCDKEKA